ncbi:MAG: polyphosphate kinase 2 family protein [Ignavibacteria bacterium]|jgi:PPK2 family polyphosphate:nucleotide phosphotransferase|nr:polyphosphate kinase 2 family protein [Ignavibacteria bacterium]
MNYDKLIVPPNKKIKLKDYDTSYIDKFKGKEEAQEKLKDDVKKMAKLQDVLYADNRYAILLIFQALDAAGKDGTIKHVMSGVNPQGCQVYSFKAPSALELDHDYLWRCSFRVPEKGKIGIFNRSYYEEVLVTRVHPEFLEKQTLPGIKNLDKLWKRRFAEIVNFEKYLTNNGIHILKFFLNVSKKEQKKRFLDRINLPEKNWKFSATDAKERQHWDDYHNAYEDMFNNTSTEFAPWYIIPADHKWFIRTAVADIIVKKLKDLELRYPEVSEEHKAELLKAKEMLENEE